MASTERPVRRWSHYQERLFQFATEETGSGMVIAVAGSGKTSSLEEMCRRLPSSLSVKYLLDRHRMPSRWARRPWQQEQERNLIYVAYTRARRRLCFVDATAIH